MLMQSAVKPISETQHKMLSCLSRLKFATADQLLYWLPLDAPTSIRRCAQALEKLNLIEINTERKPFVYRLSRSGCSILGKRYFRQWHSVAAMQQVLLSNEVEILLRQEDSKAQLASRNQLKELGLHPAHSEYAYMMPNQFSLFQCVVIDDYLMHSNRIVHKWNRSHLKDSQHAEDTELKSWSDVSDAYRVYTITPFQKQKHQDYMTRLIESGQSSIRVSVHLIDPIWGVSH